MSFDSQLDLKSETNNQRATPNQEILMIGTLEPRKNYIEVLNWFERNHLGRELTIIGRDGWKSRSVKLTLFRLRRNGVKVKWLKRASDRDLQKALKRAHIGICASLDEGYGLPLREFLSLGIPVVASDIAIFHETGDENIAFFRLGDLGSLERAVARTLARGRFTPVTTVFGWQSTYKSLIQILNKTSCQ